MFADKGMPLIMGEYDTVLNHADRLKGCPADLLLPVNSQGHFLKYLTKKSNANNVLPFLWASSVFDLATNTVGSKQILESLKKKCRALNRQI